MCAPDNLSNDTGDTCFTRYVKLVEGFTILTCKNQSIKRRLIELAKPLTNIWEWAGATKRNQKYGRC